jgi:hypothetical protein
MRAAIDSPRLGRIVPCVDARETIAAGVGARDRVVLMLIVYIARCSVEQSALSALTGPAKRVP